MNQKKYLFVGCGSIGRRHIKNLKSLEPESQILAYRVRKEPLGDFAKECPIEMFDDYDRALDQKPAAVFVTNPTSLHLATARKAAERGYPLFIEKPLSHTLEGVDSFIQLCESKKLLVLLGYKMRFHPVIRSIKAQIAEGLIGKPLSARAHYGGCLEDWHPWEDYRRMYSARKDLGGGVILDAIHELDYLYWLMGDVRRIKAIGGHLSGLDIETEDMAEILVQFQNGAVGSVHMNYVQRPEYRCCQVIGTEGTLFWDTRQKKISRYDVKTGHWVETPEKPEWQANDMFVDEMRHFLNCLAGKEKPNHSLQDAKRVLEIALQAKQQLALD